MNIDAAVVYYGRLPQTMEEVKNLSIPIMGHFGTKDQSINQAMVSGFEKALKEAGKEKLVQNFWYEANHAFANPTGANYESVATKTAWDRTLEFLKKNLG